MTQYKQKYKVKRSLGAFYTGGNVAWTEDGDILLCQCGSKIQVLDVDQGLVIATVSEEEEDTKKFDDDDDYVDEDVVLTFTMKNDLLIAAHKSKLFKMWHWKEKKLVKVWQSMHKVPVSRLSTSSDCSVLATGATDSSIRLWDLNHHACTHSLPIGGMEGVISVLLFHEISDTKTLLASADNGVIIAWDAETGAIKLSYKGHLNKVTDLVICNDSEHMVSCGRDLVFIIWNIKNGAVINTLPVYESLEAVTIVPDMISLPNFKKPLKGSQYVVVGGEKGLIKVWDGKQAKELYTQEESLFSSSSNKQSPIITKLLFSTSCKKLAVIRSDHTIVILDTEHKLETDKQLVGFSDQILDVVFCGNNQSHMAVATNSLNIQLYNISTFNCQLLKGHTDIVISLSVSNINPCLLASTAKDNSIRIWLLSGESATCVMTGYGHTGSVTGVVFNNINQKNNFLLSCSEDTTLKLWALPSKFEPDIDVLNIKYTEIAHEKDINGLCLSPNDKLAATASLDKTAKLWSTDNLSLVGVLRGHRRGVWSVRFSPVDQVLLTSSADSTFKLWSLADLSCLKTFEGHNSSVLRAEFLTRGLQIVSSGSDGLIKIWCIKTGECTATFEEHDGQIQGLAVSQDERELLTGGSDSKLIIWQDVTEEVKAEAANKREEYIMKEQQLSNLVHSKQLLPALKLALSLDRPSTVLKIVTSVQQDNEDGLRQAINRLDLVHKESLLKCASIWNSNSKTANAAQTVIAILLDELTSGSLCVDRSIIESILVYSERHFKRMTQLQQDLQILQYTSDVMQPPAKT